jgi:hypothetical protein
MVSPSNRLKRKCALYSPSSKRMRHSESTTNLSIQHVTTTQHEQTAGNRSRKAISGNSTDEAPSKVSDSSDHFLSLPTARQPLSSCDNITSGHTLILDHPHSIWKQPPVSVAEHHSLAVPTPWTNPEISHPPLPHRANFITSGSELPTIYASSTACMARSDTMESSHAVPSAPSRLIRRPLARGKAVAGKSEDINLQSNVRVSSSPDSVSSLLPASAATQTTSVAAMQDRLDHAIIQNKADLFLASLGLASEQELSRLKKGITERSRFVY